MTVRREPLVPKHRVMIDAALLMLNLLISVAFWFEHGSSEGCAPGSGQTPTDASAAQHRYGEIVEGNFHGDYCP